MSRCLMCEIGVFKAKTQRLKCFRTIMKERNMLETNEVAIVYLLWFVLAFGLAAVMLKINS